MINRLSNPDNRNRSAAKISKVMSSNIHPAQSFQHSLTNFADNCFTQFMCRNLQFSKTELHFARDNARRDSWSLVRAQNIFMINKILSCS